MRKFTQILIFICLLNFWIPQIMVLWPIPSSILINYSAWCSGDHMLYRGANQNQLPSSKNLNLSIISQVLFLCLMAILVCIRVNFQLCTQGSILAGLWDSYMVKKSNKVGHIYKANSIPSVIIYLAFLIFCFCGKRASLFHLILEITKNTVNKIKNMAKSYKLFQMPNVFPKLAQSLSHKSLFSECILLQT